ncbi:DUF1435 domain-containing protein [Erwinia tracheiphila]|nr:DUF1435 domain-containing protein [Erwinia tracheiphila]
MCGKFTQQLGSARGVLLPCALVPPIVLLDLSFNQWRTMMVMILLATLAMLCHRRSRHYLLLPPCLALISSVVVISLNFSKL